MASALLVYFQFRNEVWRFTDLWADEAEEVREYLKREWKENENVHTKDVDIRRKEYLQTEADEILEWWWKERYQSQHHNMHSDKFGKWLLQNYLEMGKVDEYNNMVPGPRSTIEISCSILRD